MKSTRSGMTQDFLHRPDQEPHRDRTKALLQAHPEMRAHIGKNRYTFLVILALVGIQLVMSVVCKGQPWWFVVAAAFFVGAFASHALWVMIHECAHNLIFKTKRLNMIAGILANLPHILPSSVSFERYHLKHHAFQGVYELDADLPSYWEARLIGNGWFGKAVWLLLFPVFQVTRPPRLREIRLLDRWVLTNIVIQMAFNVAVFSLLGVKPLFYMFFSFFFSVGLHPLGARWIQEHYTLHSPQETYSYYGPLNIVAFNVGYHNEHHDLPSVPWNHLPAIRQAAPEMYDTLQYHTSWTKLLFRFLFDRDISLFSRSVRAERGGIALSAEVKPDVEFVETAGRV